MDAAQFYVDCSASLAGNGSLASPWNSLPQASNVTLYAGDILSFKAAVTCDGTLMPKGSGNSTAPIRLMQYPLDSIDGPPILNGAGGAAAILLTNQDYWRISNLAITNPAHGVKERQGILVAANDGKRHVGITIDNNHVYDVAGQTNKTGDNASAFANSAGISVNVLSGSGGRYDDVWVRDNTVKDCGGGGIKVRVGQLENLGRRARVSYNKVDACGGDGAIIFYGEAPLLDHNIVSNLGTGKYPWTGGNFAGIWVLGNHNPTMSYNVVYGSIMSLYDSEAFDCDWGNTGTCLVEYNYSHDNAGGMFLNCDGCGTSGGAKQILRYNIFQNDCRMISVGEVPTLWFYNNVVYCPNKDFNINVPPATEIWNNIFVGTKNSSLPYTSGVEWKANVFQTVDPPTANGIWADPGFIDPGKGANTLGSAHGYQLKDGSPALANGVPVTDDGGLDFFGNDIAAGVKPNRGAYNGPGI